MHNNKLLTEKLIGYLHTVKNKFIQSPFILALICILGLTQLFFEYIPEGIFVNVSILFFIIFLSSLWFKNLTNIRKIIFYIAIPILFFIMYGIFLFTNSMYLANIILSILIFSCLIILTRYLSVKENYLNQFKTNIKNIIISLLFFIITYGLIYLTAFFIDNIFNLKLKYYGGTLYRFANCMASLVGCIVFIFFNDKEDSIDISSVSKLLFGKIIPILFIPVLLLAIIYFGKIFATLKSVKYVSDEVYYIMVCVFFFSILMMSTYGNKQLTKILLAMAGIIPILMVFILLKKDPTQYIGFSGNGKKIHEIILNISLSVGCFYFFLKNALIDYTFSKFLIVIFSILFFPIVGNFNYYIFNTKESVYKKLERTHYEDFKILYLERKKRFNNRFATEDTSEYIYMTFDLPFMLKNGYGIDTTNFKFVGINLDVTMDSEEDESVEKNKIKIQNYTFKFSEDGKNLILVTPDNTKRVYEIFNVAKEFDKNKDEKSKILMYDENDFTIYIHQYHYFKDVDYDAHIRFNIYIKK